MPVRPLALARLITAAVLSVSAVPLAFADMAPLPPPSVPAKPMGGTVAPGPYKCEFTDGGERYPVFRCVIKAVATAGGKTRLTLEKTAGSQRLRGSVTPSDSGFDFSGEFFCPHGDCTEQVQASFVRTGRNRYAAELAVRHGKISVKLWK